MSTKTKRIILSVQDDFSRPLQRYEQYMGEAERATSSFARLAGRTGGGLGQIAFSLNQIHGAAQLVGGTLRSMFNAASQWQDMGRNASQSQIALEAYAGSAKEAAKWTNAVSEAARGSMTEGQAAAEAFRLMKFGLADTADAAGDFVRDISIVSAINPQLGSTAQAIEQIQLTIANTSWLRLDQLGISAVNVRKRVDELQEETKSLSKEQAFATAVMEEIGSQADTVGDGILELDEAQRRLNARLDQFKEDAGKGALILFESLALAFEDLAATDFGKNIASQLDVLKSTLDNEPDQFWAKLFTVTGAGKITEEMVWWSSYVGLTPGGLNRDDVDFSQEHLEEIKAQDAALARAQLSQNLVGVYPGMTFGPNDIAMRGMYSGTAGDLMNAMTGFDNLYRSHPVLSQGYQDSRSRRQEYDMLMQALYGGGFMVPPEQRDPFTPAIMDARLRPGASGLRDKRFMMGYGASMLDPAQVAWMETIMDRRKYGGIRAAGAAGYMGADDMGMMWARQQSLQATQDKAGAMFGFGDNLAESLQRAASAAGDLVQHFSSLDEKFGVGGSAFDKDVYGEMADALRGVDIEAEQAEEALLAFQWATGQANGQSVLFDDKLSNLTQQFADGALTASEYADKVRELSMLDFSWLDSITAGMDFSEANAYLDRLSTLTLEGLAGVGAIEEDPFAAMGDVMYGTGPSEKDVKRPNVFSYIADDAATATDDALSEFIRLQEEGSASVTTMTDLNQQAFAGFRNDAIGDIRAIQAAMNDAFSGTYTFTVTGSAGGGPAGGSNITNSRTGYADGTPWTGSMGVNEPAGIVHGQEAVVPSQGMYVKPSPGGLELYGGGGGSDGKTVTVNLVLDGRTIHQAVIDVERMNVDQRSVNA